MKYIKQYLTLVISALVVVLALLAWLVWPLPSWKKALVDEMNERYQDKNTIDQIKNTHLDLPNQPSVTGPPSERYVEIKKSIIKEVDAQKQQVEQTSHEINARGRVKGNVPVLPLVTISGNNLTWGKEEPGFLPTIQPQRTGNDFKTDYGLQFKQWTTLLANGGAPPKDPKDFDATSYTAPLQDKLTQMYTDMQQKKADANPGAAIAINNGDSQDKMNYDRGMVINRANELLMYVEPTAFQMRPWFTTDDPPTEEQIFTALVDSWLQADVVRAIADLNNPIGRRSDKNISQSPVKRLIHLTVGNTAQTHAWSNGDQSSSTGMPVQQGIVGVDSGAGNLFFTSNTNSLTPGMTMVPVNGGAPQAPPTAPNTINYALGMTGHASGSDYDVVLMSVWMDIDPASLISFMDKLYRQNVGYTVIDVQLRTVDPLDRASNGYLYGNSQAVEVEIQVEAILYRQWTKPLMPDAVDQALGIPLAPKK